MPVLTHEQANHGQHHVPTYRFQSSPMVEDYTIAARLCHPSPCMPLLPHGQANHGQHQLPTYRAQSSPTVHIHNCRTALPHCSTTLYYIRSCAKAACVEQMGQDFTAPRSKPLKSCISIYIYIYKYIMVVTILITIMISITFTCGS